VNKAREKYILIRIQQYKDARSFTELYDALIDPIYRFIYFKVDDTDTAQDITSEVFLKCWKKLTADDAQKIKHLRAFFYMVARNAVIDYYRSAARQREVPLNPEYDDQAFVDESSEYQFQIKIEYQQILQVIKLLKDSYQEVLILRHVEDLPLVEISKVLEKSPVATRVLLHRANQALKREYEKTAPQN